MKPKIIYTRVSHPLLPSFPVLLPPLHDEPLGHGKLLSFYSSLILQGIDIPNIRNVILPGVFHYFQLSNLVTAITMTVQSYNLLQLIGRAGRCGHESRGHIFTNSREIRTCSDEALVEFCVSKENCRRRVLLNALGSSESLPSCTSFCDVCSPTADLASVFHPNAVV